MSNSRVYGNFSRPPPGTEAAPALSLLKRRERCMQLEPPRWKWHSPTSPQTVNPRQRATFIHVLVVFLMVNMRYIYIYIIMYTPSNWRHGKTDRFRQGDQSESSCETMQVCSPIRSQALSSPNRRIHSSDHSCSALGFDHFWETHIWSWYDIRHKFNFRCIKWLYDYVIFWDIAMLFRIC